MTMAQDIQNSLSATETLLDYLRRRQRQVPTTWILMTVNLVVFIAMLGFGAGLWHSPNNIQLAWGANFGPATQDGQWWRLGTAMFIHFGVLHLAMNMWALWDGGNFVERLYGSGRFVALYAASGLVGNLVSLSIQGNRAVSAGASGAIFGLYGALLVALWRERHFLHPHEFKWMFWGAAAFSVVMICFGLLVTGIDNAAHLGGLATGTLLGIAFYRPVRPANVIRPITRAAAVGVMVVVVCYLFLNLPVPKYRWSEESAARSEIDQFLRQEASIGNEWSALVARENRRELSFTELAARVDTDIAERYDRSFDQLSRLSVSPEMPSAAAVRLLRGYADIRREESHALAEGLRSGDAKHIGKAKELGIQAEAIARQLSPTGHPENGRAAEGQR
jgi:rhomboid protease GluP